MKKELTQTLRSKAADIARLFSNPDRALNNNKEIFTVLKIEPLSETSAAITYEKYPTGKRALVFAYYINSGEGYWAYFFPTDSHLLGIDKLKDILHEIEVYNFNKNE